MLVLKDILFLQDILAFILLEGSFPRKISFVNVSKDVFVLLYERDI